MFISPGSNVGGVFCQEGTENRPLFPQNGPQKEHYIRVTGVMDSARNRSKKSLENTIKKLSENTEYDILYHGFL